MAAVTVSRCDERLIAIKQVPAERAAEVQREAQLLERLAHPSVVRFVDLVETPDGGRALHTEFVSSHTWATRPLTDPAERAAAMASLAAVVADLHDLGLAHLRIAPGHVLHGEDDRPVLCGLARAGEATADNRYADLAALADLCHDDDLDKGPLSGKLSSIADAARSGQLSARDLARRLDHVLAKRAPRPDAPPRHRPGLLASARHIGRPAVYTVAALTLVVASALAVANWHDRGPGPSTMSIHPAVLPSSDQARLDSADAGLGPAPEADGKPPTAPTDQAAPPSETTEPARGSSPVRSADSPASGSGSAQTTPRSPTPGDRVPAHWSEAVYADAAKVLDHNGRRYAIGLAGDLVTTGDWDCDGDATPAIVRPATGAVVLFDAWPDPGETISMPVRWNVPAAVGVEASRNESCDLLRVVTASGSRLLDPRSTP